MTEDHRIEIRRFHPAVLVLAGGLMAGTLDIVYACVFWGIKRAVPVERILQSVAAGLLGKASYSGGVATAALGLLLHYSIAVTMALVYYIVARRWPMLWQRPVRCGAAYGLLLYGIMNLVVVPLSAAGPGSRDPLWIVLSVAAHVFLVGIPIATCIRYAAAPPPHMELSSGVHGGASPVSTPNAHLRQRPPK